MAKKQSSVQPVPPTVSEKAVTPLEVPKKEMNTKPKGAKITQRSPLEVSKKEMTTKQEVKPQNQKPIQSDTTKTGEPKLVLKNGATDCRRSEKALSKVIDEKMNMDSHNGDVYAFANTSKKLVKLVQFEKTGANLYKKHTNIPVDWPPYDRESSVLEGSRAKQFLDDIKLPKGILKKTE